MANKRYKLLTTAIVTALDASNPTARGAVWEPAEVMEKQEAEALLRSGYAEETKSDITAETVNVRNSKAKGARAPLSGIVDATRQDDGTFRNRDGVRVNEDGTPFADGDDELVEMLTGNVDDVVAGLADLSPEQRTRLGALEAGGKGRKGIADAIAAYDEAE